MLFGHFLGNCRKLVQLSWLLFKNQLNRQKNIISCLLCMHISYNFHKILIIIQYSFKNPLNRQKSIISFLLLYIKIFHFSFLGLSERPSYLKKRASLLFTTDRFSVSYVRYFMYFCSWSISIYCWSKSICIKFFELVQINSVRIWEI